jgi:hypothetical protein
LLVTPGSPSRSRLRAARPRADGRRVCQFTSYRRNLQDTAGMG